MVFLADGEIVDELTDPTADTVLERMKHIDARRTADGADGDRPAQDGGGSAADV